MKRPRQRRKRSFPPATPAHPPAAAYAYVNGGRFAYR